LVFPGMECNVFKQVIYVQPRLESIYSRTKVRVVTGPAPVFGNWG
jgi:hypothetical protein